MNVSKVTEKDFHMGDSMRLFDLLATDRIDRVVLNAEHGPMGATEVTWWNSKIGLILEKHSSNGGESLIIHPASATTCPGHGRSECVSCCWPKGDGYTAVDMGTAAADGYREGASELLEALEPFVKLSSSEETISLIVKTSDIAKARAAINRAKARAAINRAKGEA